MNDGPVTSPGTSLVAAVTQNPVLVLVETEKFGDFYEAIRREVEAHKPDLSTKKGRDAIASLAYRVTRTKTAIDDAGKKLNEDARKQIAVVDAARRDIRDRLDALATQARRPLTDWEAAEEERLSECRTVIACLEAAATIGRDDTSITVAERLAWVEAAQLSVDVFQDLRPAAVGAQATAIGALQSGRDRLLQEEADRAELARLRAEAAEREEAARRAAEEEARAEAARVKAEAEARAEEQRKRLEADRIERERREAAEAAQREAERQAREEQERIEAAHRAEQEKLRRQAEEAERALAAERAAREREERERQAEAERVAAEERKRQADQEHRRKIMRDAKEAIMSAASITEEAARAIVLAIARDQIPHVSIKF